MPATEASNISEPEEPPSVSQRWRRSGPSAWSFRAKQRKRLITFGRPRGWWMTSIERLPGTASPESRAAP